MKRFRKWIGWQLRCAADVIDRDHAFVAFAGILHKSLNKSGYDIYFTEGIQFPKPIPGAQLYYNSADYDEMWQMYNEMKERGLI